MRWIAVIAMALGVSGCAVPAAVSIASVALDATSYVISGKTVADHGLSLALDEDCALLRVLEGEICREKQDYEVAATALVPLPDESMDLDLVVAAGTDANAEVEDVPPPDAPWGAGPHGRFTDRAPPEPAATAPYDEPIGGDYLAADFIDAGT